MLNEWDPIGVFGATTEAEIAMPEWPADEYDCLRWPLGSRLRGGASRRELADLLQEELDQHFGIGGNVSDDDRVIDRLQAWWASTGEP